jgi:UDP-2-acetamido-3-amino-2,3-dideoxy-glucuronate N-acetyltransferase
VGGPGAGVQTGARIQGTADVDPSATIGDGTVVWHLAQVREGAQVGTGCVLGRGSYVGSDVHVGDNVKIQNYALVYEPAVIEDGVFIGPAVVLTNDRYPRAVAPDGALKSADDWNAEGVTVRQGAALGARSVILAGVTVGRWAVVGAGSVVTRDVPDFSLVVGVPARRIGWVGPAGEPLVAGDAGEWTCPTTGDRFTEVDGALTQQPRA